MSRYGGKLCIVGKSDPTGFYYKSPDGNLQYRYFDENDWTVNRETMKGREAEPAAGYVTKDSGERREFSTGSRRDKATGKGRYDLIPAFPIHLLAQLYERGAEKYGDRNWEKGQPLSVYRDSSMRHGFFFQGGDRSEDHLTAQTWNNLAFIWTLNEIKEGRLPESLDDIGEIARLAAK